MIAIEELTKKFVRGGPYLKYQDPEVIFEIASRGKTYVEIGTMWGGSAIVAGLAGCEVHCIDPWIKDASPDDVLENWVGFGLDSDKLFLYQQWHPPWPGEIKDRRFDIGMIDGTHKAKECLLDWEGMSAHVTQYVLFHDVNSYPDIYGVYRHAAEGPEWEAEFVPFVSQYAILRHT